MLNTQTEVRREDSGLRSVSAMRISIVFRGGKDSLTWCNDDQVESSVSSILGYEDQRQVLNKSLCLGLIKELC